MTSYKWGLINDNITEEDRKVLSEFILSKNRLTNGDKVKEFEKIWSDWLGVKKSTMVNSGNSANFISIAIVKELLGIGEVIVPSMGWVSDLSSIVQLGMKPVVLDVSYDTLSITADDIKRAITEDTKAIVLVHCLGFNGLTDEIIQIAKDNEILLIEDCCEAHGATFKDKKVGSYGDISIFSFYFGHHITTIEGGMVCTNNNKIHDLSRMFRSHGMTREASSETQNNYIRNYPELNPLFTFAVAGFNMRSTELNAVLGIEQMKRIDYNIQRRVSNLKTWLENLNPRKYKTDFNLDGNSSFALPLVVQETYKDKFNINDDYDSVIDILYICSVEYRVGMAGGGNQQIQPYLEKFDHRTICDLKNINYLHKYSLYIGNHPELTDEQIINLCKLLNNV